MLDKPLILGVPQVWVTSRSWLLENPRRTAYKTPCSWDPVSFEGLRRRKADNPPIRGHETLDCLDWVLVH